MITERTLKKWRKEALLALHGNYPEDASTVLFEDFSKHILQMTQELLDQDLIRRTKCQ